MAAAAPPSSSPRRALPLEHLAREDLRPRERDLAGGRALRREVGEHLPDRRLALVERVALGRLDLDLEDAVVAPRVTGARDRRREPAVDEPLLEARRLVSREDRGEEVEPGLLRVLDRERPEGDQEPRHLSHPDRQPRL